MSFASAKNSKLELYAKLKNVFDFELYLSENIYWKHKIALARFRCVNHHLAIETDRYIGTSKNERFCKFCKTEENLDIVEDEIHFLLVCPQFTNLRNNYLSKYMTTNPNLSDNFVKIMQSKNSNCIKDLSKYIYHAFKGHAEYRAL